MRNMRNMAFDPKYGDFDENNMRNIMRNIKEVITWEK
jgi:hypothetical protein